MRRSVVSTLTSEEWADIYLGQDGLCYYCGKEPEGRDITQDHVIPLSKGGNHIKENIVMACQSCNSKKGNKV